MALTGSAFGSTCYSSVSAAANAYFSSVVPVFDASGNLHSVVFQSSIWQEVVTNSAGVVLTSNFLPVPALSACDPMQGFNDGLALAAIVVTCSALAMFWGILSKAGR